MSAHTPGIRFTEETDEGEEITHVLPSKFEVCARCRGAGKHVNPSIDGDGLTREDFDEDPDFEESYFRGDYDVSCEECDGLRVVEVLDDEACASDYLKAIASRYYAALESEAASRREDAYCRRMGF